MIQLTDYNTCVICLQNIIKKPYILNCCNTYYHFNCIQKWINTKLSCPHCRKTIVNGLYNIPENNILPIHTSNQDSTVQLSPLDTFVINYPYIFIILALLFEITMLFFILYLSLYIYYQ